MNVGYQVLCHTCNFLKELERKRSNLSDSSINRNSRLRYQKLRLEVLIHYTNGTIQCACKGCNENRLDALSIDHINGGGNRHINSKGMRGRFYWWLKQNNYPKEYRVLCMNCNMADGFYGQCPHEKTNGDMTNGKPAERTGL